MIWLVLLHLLERNKYIVLFCSLLLLSTKTLLLCLQRCTLIQRSALVRAMVEKDVEPQRRPGAKPGKQQELHGCLVSSVNPGYSSRLQTAQHKSFYNFFIFPLSRYQNLLRDQHSVLRLFPSSGFFIQFPIYLVTAKYTLYTILGII